MYSIYRKAHFVCSILPYTILLLSFFRACVALGVSGIACGLSYPSPSPAYKGQNDLPAAFSGQLPYFCICMTLCSTNLRIAAHLHFWKERQATREADIPTTGDNEPDKKDQEAVLLEASVRSGTDWVVPAKGSVVKLYSIREVSGDTNPVP